RDRNVTGVQTCALPICIGAMIDFGPLLSNPKLFLCGAAAQAGIFLTIIIAVVLGFDLKDAASIGIIGAADGPTSILVSQTLGSRSEERRVGNEARPRGM